ncbi:hypothetical protein [Derxia gummosa]|uniref:adenosine deaminase n=1 Tax=Derxia gummosa DSM 723 TaxID=1121388 RepID=A0A8B6XBK3_9BURK|nr:hypothetical protein [Derxia gummosa]
MIALLRSAAFADPPPTAPVPSRAPAPCRAAGAVTRALTALAGAALLVLAAPAAARDAGAATGPRAAAASRDEAATARYYAALVNASPQRLAELTAFTTQLPKGGDLHHHYSGALYAETYLDWVGKAGACVWRDDVPGVAGAQRFHIATAPATLPETAREHCLSADKVIADDRFFRQLLMTWSDKDFGNHPHDALPPDEQFFDTFGYFGPISGWSYRDGLAQLRQRALDENVQYLETMLRSGPKLGAASADGPHQQALIDRISALGPAADEGELIAALAALADAVEADPANRATLDHYLAQLAEAHAGLDDERFTLRFQTYVTRGNPAGDVFASLLGSFLAAKASPLVVGVNIVGPENGHVAMRDYALHMRMFRFLGQRYPGVKLALHAGELVLGMVPPEGLQDHIRQAVEVAGARRIGHGIDLAHERRPWELLDELRARQVAIEINLSSNDFILGVKGEAHPLVLYRRAGVPYVISTDDAGVSRNNLSGEYALFASRYRPGYAQLKQAAYSSLRHSFMSEADKAEQLRRLDARYAAFEASVARAARRLDAGGAKAR